eukprot:scaffold32280_cov133-Isochrysis_galbana.AAC.3
MGPPQRIEAALPRHYKSRGRPTGWSVPLSDLLRSRRVYRSPTQAGRQATRLRPMQPMRNRSRPACRSGARGSDAQCGSRPSKGCALRHTRTGLLL